MDLATMPDELRLGDDAVSAHKSPFTERV